MRHILSPYGYMALRSISRSKFRSAFVAVGISFAFAIMTFMASYNEMFDVLMFDRFTKAQVFDMQITMTSPVAYTPLVEAVYRLEGVERAEAILEVPVSLSHRHLNTGVMLTAIREDSDMFFIYDNQLGINLPPSRGGVILSSSLAQSLGAGRGSVLLMDAPTAGREEIRLPVVDVVNENLGATAYIEIESLWDILGIPPTATSAIVRTYDTYAIMMQLRGVEAIAAVNDQTQMMAAFEEMMGTYAAMLFVMQLMGIGIAYAIITASSSISLSERKREYATLRVLGMQPKEVAEIMSFEYWVLSVIGIAAGVPLQHFMRIGINDMMGTDMFSVPLSTPTSAYIQAAVLCAIAVLISNLSARRKIAKFEMVEVLKERE